MQLILTEERADFDTIGAMLGAFVLHPDTALVLPEHFTPSAQRFMHRYYHKLPFEDHSLFQDGENHQYLYPQLDGLLFGFDYLQSLQIARQLQATRITLDNFFATTILLGIYASTNNINSFSADEVVNAVVPYLLEEGADEALVREWLDIKLDDTTIGLPVMTKNVVLPADDLWHSVPAWQRLLEQVVGDAAREKHLAVYLVGGVVRDMKLGRSSRDLDFVVEGNAISLGQELKELYGGSLVIHKPFGTARWEINDALMAILSRYPMEKELDINAIPIALDLITARTEWYDSPAQLPKVRISRIDLDLRRRDFTVNALGMRLDSVEPEMLDVCGGMEDLHRNLIRALHPLSFRDDPTRLFRAVRYEQRLGFIIELETERWMREALHWVKDVSGDRLRHELNLMLTEADPAANFRRMMELGLLGSLHPNLQWSEQWGRALRIALQEPIDSGWNFLPDNGNLTMRQWLGYGVWLGQQEAGTVSKVCSVLRFSKTHSVSFHQLNSVVSHVQQWSGASNSELTAALDPLNIVMVYALDCLYRDHKQLHERIITYRDVYRDLKPVTTGDGLRALGVPQGKIYTELLNLLRNAWLDGLVHSVDEELTYLIILLKQQGLPFNE